jgi:cyclic di-GMP phosphodiesterase
MAAHKQAINGTHRENDSRHTPSIILPLPTSSASKAVATILVVDGEDINRRLLRAMLRTGPYRILEARRSSEAVRIIAEEELDLIIIDLVMPEISGADLCRMVKSERRTQLIPILMLTNVGGSQNEIDGIAAGADEFLTKPLHPEVVRTRIRAMLRNKAAIDSLEEAETILFALAQAVEARDSYTGGHCKRLADYSVALGQALGLSEEELVALHRGGYLHDIGKVAVPDAIMFKPGPLDEEEWVIMRAHTTSGEEICKPMRTLAPVLPIIRSHHERWDGTGYPDGLAGEDIPLLARILQTVDVYDALTTARSYKKAHSQEEAFRIMEEESARGWRDAELLALFRDICDNFRGETGRPMAPNWVEVPTMSQSLEAMRRQLNK